MGLLRRPARRTPSQSLRVLRSSVAPCERSMPARRTPRWPSRNRC